MSLAAVGNGLKVVSPESGLSRQADKGTELTITRSHCHRVPSSASRRTRTIMAVIAAYTKEYTA